MWELKVEGRGDEIYRKLKKAFDDEVVVKQEQEFKVTHRDERGEVTYKKEVAVVDDVTSLQFRRVLKFVQLLTNDMSGTLRVSCSGDPGKVINVKVEVA